MYDLIIQQYKTAVESSTWRVNDVKQNIKLALDQIEHNTKVINSKTVVNEHLLNGITKLNKRLEDANALLEYNKVMLENFENETNTNKSN